MNMFPRGIGPLASVMIASRGRPQSLKRAILSCYNLAKDPRSVEVIVKIDDDDAPTKEMIESILKEERLPVKAIETPRGRGFLEMNSWVNMMASFATGDWLILLNDDAYFVTQDWDSVLFFSGVKSPHFGYESIFLFTLQHTDESGSFAWPCLRRQTYEILGHFSPILACDWWIWRVLWIVNATAEAPIQVKHDRLEHEGGEARQGIVDVNEFMQWQASCVDSLGLLINDVATIVNSLMSLHDKLKWKKTPDGDGWYWWRISEVANEFLVLAKGDEVVLFPYASDGECTIKSVADLEGWWARPLSAYEEKA